MSSLRSRMAIECMLRDTDVTLDGPRPWDPRIHDDRFFRRVLAEGSLGLGESYMDGWWDCPRIDELMERVFRAGVDRRMPRSLPDRFESAKARLWNLQRASRADQVGKRHYDLGDDLFRIMLDERQIYSCGYWRHAATLDEAQEAKLDLAFRKLQLKPGMRVLDIGCGWGGAARFAARRHQVEVVGITISREQAKIARERCRGLPVEIRLQDYRNLRGRFDRIFSIGMFEHVGAKNHRELMQIARDRLAPDGLFLLHTIGGSRSVRNIDPWLGRYIFPNAMLPSMRQVSDAIEGLFVMEDWHNFGADYDQTLLHWHQNFEQGWPQLADRYDERFHRMWRYYLLSCAGSFRARRNQLWQIVLSSSGVPGGYVRCS